MSDYMVILLAILFVLTLNCVVWVVRDMDREANRRKETERWLNSQHHCPDRMILMARPETCRGEPRVHPINTKEK